MIRLVVSDLDGTLLTKEREVAKHDREALQMAVERGADLCLASGRMQVELEHVAEELGIPCHEVSQNGSFVRTKEGEPLHQSAFSPKLTKEIFQKTRDVNLFMMVCFEHDLLSPVDHPYGGVVRERLFAPIQLVDDLPKRFDNGQFPCKFSYFGDLELCQGLKEELDRHFAGEVDTLISDKDCLDVMPVGVSKGVGLQALTRHLGIQADEVLCLGDAFNDVSMFRHFPRYSCAMAHAPEGVRREASRTVASVADGIHQVYAE
ncbi:hypothetical protein SAMN04488112_1114 [Melghirimyces thermohalophilus]|uniref:Cof subfamily of IIB subfamily of haloacid dehalogenase superfamily/HAD-superfamily hydrolase, subfamily IIB n=1 Tax=Melghirimyces thermohalophilus TaxID=1236220 RepID=A0A1G6MVA4_9BACL|nr:HAD family hydrolase [Melghirimyces thermohalophilus]SDC59459.1 hypothetical protein SAMN04488112_1114 [Melghirimyces thermohalophilus]